MISNLIRSLVVAIVATLGSILLGSLLMALGGGFAIIVVIGSFMKEFATLLGLLAGLWYYFH